MKTETLEALLIDHALGALSSEVGELLEAYQAGDPSVAEQAANLSAAVRLARQAMVRPKTQPVRRLPPLAQWRRQAAVQRWQARAWEVSRLAAAVLLGLALGWHTWKNGDGTRLAAVPPSTAPLSQTVAADRSGAAAPARSFWSMSSFAAGRQPWLTADGRSDARYRLHWESPVKIPQVEGNL
jgi:hypothetical protein